MNNKKYTDFLENLICDLFDEIRCIANSHKIDIDNGDSNYNYYMKEFRQESYNHYNKKGK